ncbi:MAG: LUD domain-containing protein, partial [Clostridia bacterium]|nr:LUD domain-containing protein [Clostridia bacterium]
MEIRTLLENLEARGYRARYFPTAAGAADCLAAEIRGETVGIGGSITVRELGLAPRLAEHNEVVWHWEPREGVTPAEELASAAHATVYLSSVNAIAKTGEIVNIDGTGNRLSATLFGPRRVYFIVGVNKIEKDEAAAI